MDTPSPLRTCPACGAQTEANHCPADGTRTLHMQPLRADATLLFAGELIADRYRVTEVIGRGGFGAVYRAIHTGTRQAVALKLLHARDSADGGFDQTDARRFFREAEITASLRHPNTVRVFDLGQTDRGALYLAMELLEGETLEAQLRRLSLAGQWMAVDEVVRVACDVLGSLGEAHDLGLVHRDLKPANLMRTTVAGDPVTKVLDFGIARQAGSSLTSGSSAVGTPQYMAPEQCMGQPVDGRADLYALGVILFRCLGGCLPFNDPNPMTVMMQQVADPPPDLLARAGPRVPRAVGQVVARALAKDPAERFADARAMRAALQACLNATPVDNVALSAAPTAATGPTTMPLAPAPTPHTGATPAAIAVGHPQAAAATTVPQQPAATARLGLGLIGAATAGSLTLAVVGWWAWPAPFGGGPVATAAPSAATDLVAPRPVAQHGPPVVAPSQSAPAEAVPPAAAPTAAAEPAPVRIPPTVAAQSPPAAVVLPKPARPPASRPRQAEQKHYVD